jgi:molybdopterin-guanine dinucleotide biosynthesis protein A
MRIAAAILAGGKASRLGGIRKGLLPTATDGPLVQRLMGQLAAAGIGAVILAGGDAQAYAPFARTIVADLHPGSGPLGGVEAALSHLAPRYDAVLLLPCDLPNISAEEITVLLRAHAQAPDRVVMAETAECSHPLCAVVPIAALAEVSAAVAAGRYGVGRLWRTLGAVAVRIHDCSRLVNINTPADLDRWRQTMLQDATSKSSPLPLGEGQGVRARRRLEHGLVRVPAARPHPSPLPEGEGTQERGPTKTGLSPCGTQEAADV